MQGFQQILAEAAQLKESQLKKDRKSYEGLPEFLKAGLGYYKKYEEVRKQHFLFQYRVSHLIKQEGNQLYKTGNYSDALHKYEESLSIFRYIFSKSYQDMKDQDLKYLAFDSSTLSETNLKKLKAHLTALYLNISSCLTKLGKKEDAVFSGEEALKIEVNPKAYYKKAQAYLQDVNRDKDDIRLAILELKEAYNLSKDQFFIKEMHEAKKNYQSDKEKSKTWFKSMFDKTKSQKDIEKDKTQKYISSESVDNSTNSEQQRKPKNSEQFQKIRAAQQTQEQKLQNSKKSLQAYVNMDEESWLERYNLHFLNKHGSKLYSILKIDGFENEAYEYRSILAKTLEGKEGNKKMVDQWINWLMAHPIKPISRYLHKYDIQTSWIKQQRQSYKNMAAQSVPKEIQQQIQSNFQEEQTKKQPIKEQQGKQSSLGNSKQKKNKRQGKISPYLVAASILLLSILALLGIGIDFEI